MANKPIDTLRDGSIKATIWKRTTDSSAFYSVELTRSYKDEAGQWHDASSFIGDELLRIARLAGKAYDRTEELRQQDRAAADPTPGDGRRS
jgi:hypothetical protein